jgi:hypothetical protein
MKISDIGKINGVNVKDILSITIDRVKYNIAEELEE